MNKTVRVEGDPVQVDDQTTVGDLRDAFDIPSHDIVTYADGDHAYTLGDNDRVVDAVDEDQNIVFQPDRSPQFGGYRTVQLQSGGTDRGYCKTDAS